MGSLFSSPKKPEPLNVGAVTASANAQNLTNAYQNASLNRVNQTDALGNTLTYTKTGTNPDGSPIYSATQGLGQYGQEAAGGLGALGKQYYATAGQGAPDSTAAFNRAYDLASANLEPRFQRAQDQAYTKLRNQGFDPSSEAFRNASNDLALQQNEARNNLVTQLQGQMFTQGMQGRQQQMSELQPGVQFANNALSPSYANAPSVNVGNVDVAGLANQSKAQEWQGYNADIAQRNAMMGGLAGIGGSLLMAPMTGGTSLGGMMGKKAIGGLGSLFG